MILALAPLAAMAVTSASPDLAHPIGLAQMQPYPGTDGPFSGAVIVASFKQSVHVSWRLTGVPPACRGGPRADVANSCGIHIHEGTSCDSADEVGGHFYDSDAMNSDPWAEQSYKSVVGFSGGYLYASIGKHAQEMLDRVMVVHDENGGRIGCGIIKSTQMRAKSGRPIKFTRYPGYEGDLDVYGKAKVFEWAKNTVTLTYDMSNVDTACARGPPQGVPNACGIHIHAGTSCDDANLVGGHFYDSVMYPDADPWAHITYRAKGKKAKAFGMAHVEIGETVGDVQGRVVVVHDGTGARVACASIPFDIIV